MIVMKKYLAIFAVASVFAACQPKQDLNVNRNLVPLDTTRLYNNSILTDTAKTHLADPNMGVKKTVTTTTTTIEPVAAGAAGAVAGAAVAHHAVRHSSGVHHSRSYSSGGSGGTYVAPAPERPRGMSSAAKDAAIGGVGGAVLGGVLGHSVGGAVIGGVIGGGAGYAIGRARDRKTGRVARGRAYRRYKRGY
ncbi:MAG: hypothetical protein NVSMB45_03600 [Ginsengibacter sp.]